jgi:hypothetical protein
MITCAYCGRTRELFPSYVNRRQRNFCSRACSGASRRKKDSIEFDGDLFFRNFYGYYFSKRTKRFLHRVVWEQHHGPLPKGHKVYFKDKNPDNWSIDNLYLKELNPQGKCDECGKKIYARGKCVTHYYKMRTEERRKPLP